MTGDDVAREVEAVRGRLIERVQDRIREATEMTDMRATERLLDVIEERSDDEETTAIVAELRRRGDTLVRSHDLRALLDAYAGDDTARDELESALERLQRKVGSRPR
jgi:predicted mannosyl-3-phosphoglycerate phosphatase (HAD superfamily)